MCISVREYVRFSAIFSQSPGSCRKGYVQQPSNLWTAILKLGKNLKFSIQKKGAWLRWDRAWEHAYRHCRSRRECNENAWEPRGSSLFLSWTVEQMVHELSFIHYERVGKKARSKTGCWFEWSLAFSSVSTLSRPAQPQNRKAEMKSYPHKTAGNSLYLWQRKVNMVSILRN